MRTPRIYQAESLHENCDYALSKDASQHLGKVLRLNIEDQVTLFDGNGSQIAARISNLAGKHVMVHTTSAPQQSPAARLPIHLGLAISKGDRMDYAIQKSVEAGVSAITPLTSERTVVKLDDKRAQKRNEHWLAIIINACEQCGQNYLPLLHPVMSIAEWAAQATTGHSLFFDAAAQATLHEQKIAHPVRIAIGPEGGLSADELSMLAAAGFTGIRMGPRILRTETAAVSACVALQVLFGDYQET